MSIITSYKTTAFKETQKFLVTDPATQSPSLVLGSDLVSYITPLLNYVRADTTRLSAENTDYDVGTLVQTSGATSPGDNFAATYLVVEGGTGDFPMLNGNDLLVIKGDELLREQLIDNTVGDGSDLVVHTGTSDTVTEALNKRTIYVGSVAELESLPTAGFVDGQMFSVKGGQFKYVLAEDSFEPVGSIPIDAFGTVVGDGTANDYGTFAIAGSWLKASPYRRLALKGGKTYLLTYTGNLFFNGIEGNGADVIIDSGGFLEYSRAVSNDEIYLNNVNIYKAGDRTGRTGTRKDLYVDEVNVTNAHVKFVDVYGITDKADKTSWSDDIGQTRFGRVLRFGADYSDIESVRGFGVGLLLQVNAVAGATHKEKSVTLYNGETAVFVNSTDYQNLVFEHGESKLISIVNSVAQADYWMGMDSGIDINGKDALLVGAKHKKYQISFVSSLNAIERDCYIQCGNTNMSGIYSDGCNSGTHVKRDAALFADLMPKNTLSDIHVVDIDDASVGNAVFGYYGIKDFSLEGFSCAALDKSVRDAFSFSDGIDGATIRGGKVQNMGALARISRRTGDLDVSDIDISDVNLTDVYASLGNTGTVLYVDSDAGVRTSNVSLRNITHKINAPDSTKVTDSAYYMNQVDNVILYNVEGWSRRVPFSFIDCTNAVIKKSSFNISTDNNAAVFFDRIFSNTDFIANDFDFTLSCNDFLESIPLDIKVRCVGFSDAPINCAKQWSEIIMTLDIPDNTTFFVDVPLGAGYSYDLSATLGGSKLLLANDGSGSGTTTVVRDFGSRLSNTDSTTAIRVYNDGSGNIIVRNDTADFGATPITGGQLKIVMTR